jgi:hypothetical protein
MQFFSTLQSRFQTILNQAFSINFRRFSMSENGSENRTIKRLVLNLPLRVQGKDSVESEWEEISRLKDVSASGACFSLKRKVESGHLIQLTMPMPMKFRAFDHFAPQYKVWALIRHVIFHSESELYSIGTAFIGKRPPQSYQTNPNTLYQLAENTENGLWYLSEKQDTPSSINNEKIDLEKADEVDDKRKKNRYKIPLNVIIQKSDERGQMFAGEASVTEDISNNGACVLTSLSVQQGDFIRFTCDQYNVSILSIVRGNRIGQDNISRIHLEFVDQKFPIEKI